jgi:hypothetical protein
MRGTAVELMIFASIIAMLILVGIGIFALVRPSNKAAAGSADPFAPGPHRGTIARGPAGRG